jgi:drug/metabolite transporter (DMT)-like permease
VTIRSHVKSFFELEDGRDIPFAPTRVSEVGDGDARAIGWTAYLGAMPTALGFATWSYALSRASAVAALNYLIPVVAILLGWMYLGERPSILAVAGGSLCLVGVYVARHGRVKRRH